MGYVLQRGGQCMQPATWAIDQAFAQITAVTDSTVQIVFRKAGTVKLYGYIVTPCEVISDSLLITVFDNPAAVTLGPDVPLCDTVHQWRMPIQVSLPTYGRMAQLMSACA